MTVLMLYPGIDGTVLHKGRQKWIQFDSFSWGGGFGSTARAGADSRKPEAFRGLKEIVITKKRDMASAELWWAVQDGRLVDQVYFEIEKRAVLIVSGFVFTDFSIFSGDGPQREAFTCTFTNLS